MNSVPGTPPPPSSNSTTAVNGDKLSGQLIIKAQLGNDIRKMMIHNEELTLNELLLMMVRIFAGKISNSDEITIKYLDDDGDKITLLNDSDLTVALHFHKLLRLFVFVNDQEQSTGNSTDDSNKQGNFIDAKTFRTELQQIRNSVQTILDRLQLPSATNQEKEVNTTVTAPTTVVSNSAREFDPLKNTRQRSATPDSIRSKSSSSHQIPNHEQKTFQPSPVQPQPVESSDVQQAQLPAMPQVQMPTPSFPQQTFGTMPTNEQQAKLNAFGPPPTNFSNMPSLPSSMNTTRFPTAFPTANTLPNASTTQPFGSAPTPPPTSAGQPSSFIGQQTAPPQQSGFYGQQQALSQPRPPFGNYNPPNSNSAFGQQNQPPSNSSPATINPSFIQPPPMANQPPPMASQQPYGGYAPQNSYYNPAQQYPKAS